MFQIYSANASTVFEIRFCNLRIRSNVMFFLSRKFNLAKESVGKKNFLELFHLQC